VLVNNYECKSADTLLNDAGQQDITLLECEQKVKNVGGLYFVWISTGNNCFIEHTCSATCPEGWNELYPYWSFY
jgi:hypothetical protein